MRNLTAYVTVMCFTFVLGLIANEVCLSIVRQKLSPTVSSIELNSLQQSEKRRSTKSDPCDEPLVIARTGIVIREIPFSVIQACVKADQAKTRPTIDAKRAKSILGQD